MATIPVSFRIPEDAHQRLSLKAKEANMTLTSFFKQAIIDDRSVVLAQEKKSKDKTQLIFLYSKTSNNLNQLAHRAHIDNLNGKLSDSIYREIAMSLNVIRIELQRGFSDA